MLAEQRQSMILALVNQHGSLSITELQRKLKVSRETIRRDLMVLADRGTLRKTHGGALALEPGEPLIAVREAINTDAKQAIGRLAARLVPDGATVMLGGGSTVQAVADALLEHQGLTVITNSVTNCSRLAGRNKNRVFMLGGEIQTANNTALGRDATAMLAHYSADVAIVGAGAVSPTGWVMDYTREEAELYGQMLQSARLPVVVADHSKFNQHAPVRLATFETITHLVSDRRPDGSLAKVLAKLPVELVTADRSGA